MTNVLFTAKDAISNDQEEQMNALILNGSPRKGNTYTAIEALKEGLTNIDNLQISQIDTTSVSVSPCLACDYCKTHSNCAFNDDTNAVINAIAEADLLVFATPVYWWGISAQLKVIIDKFYSQQKRLSSSKKQIGLIIMGQLATDNPQYQLIHQQIKCISDFLEWELVFCHSYSAYCLDDFAKNQAGISEVRQLWKKIHK